MLTRSKVFDIARLLLAGSIGAAVVWYLTLDKPSKNYLKSIAKQVPYLPGRYAV